MRIRTPSDHVLNKLSLAPQAVGAGATVNGTGVDKRGWETAQAAIDIGAVVDAANTSVTVKLQESSDDGVSDAYADVSGATTGAVLNAGQNEPYTFDINLSDRERYLRLVATGGSVGGGLVSGEIVLMDGRTLPPTQDNTPVQVGYT